jgi:4-phospho-D-threonate 3-dehydrogenase / 4-phospho-D-erythronate 3-dehydrogenase
VAYAGAMVQPETWPLVAVTMGDPGGIGPEVIVKSLADRVLRERARFVVLGPAATMELAATATGTPVYWTVHEGAAWADGFDRPGVRVADRVGEVGGWWPRASAAGGALSFALVEEGITMAQCEGAALVTGPISKEAWAMAGHRAFPGHTELLAARAGTDEYGMMFVGPGLRVILATAHVPLARVAGLLTVKRVLRAIRLGAAACERLGIARPRVGVCGLNPHAGEGGLLGEEDEAVIAPAIAAARQAGIDATGPWPGDTVFGAALAPPRGQGRFDVVVAMYHDQGLGPVKTVARDETVNVTVGLPFVRTSPDHGTAFDIAGRGVANPGSMRAALDLALQMLKA